MNVYKPFIVCFYAYNTSCYCCCYSKMMDTNVLSYLDAAQLLSADIDMNVMQQINQPTANIDLEQTTSTTDMTKLMSDAVQTLKTNKYVKPGLYIAGGVAAVLLLSGACYLLYTEHQKKQRKELLDKIKQQRQQQQQQNGNYPYDINEQQKQETIFQQSTFGVL